MVIKVGVFGSCASRDVFNSSINANYKDYFKNYMGISRSSIISSMQPPLIYDEDSIKILPETKENLYFTKEIKSDFTKRLLTHLQNVDIDYLIMDNDYDVFLGLLYVDNQIITNNHIVLKYTDFYKNLKEKPVLTIQDNTEEYLELYYDCCDKLFTFFEEKCPNMQVVLNPVRKKFIIKKNNSFEFRKDFKHRANLDNDYISLLDEYIVNNYDVHVLLHDKELLDANHKWGCGPVHYEYKYYESITNQLLEMEEVNKLSKLNNNPHINSRYKQYRRRIYSQQTKLNKLKTLRLAGDHANVTKKSGEVIFKKYHLVGNKHYTSDCGKLRAYSNDELIAESDIESYESTIYIQTKNLPKGENRVHLIYFDETDYPQDGLNFIVTII